MRIKAVLRDTEILKMEPGSKNRNIAAAKKNLERIISWSSLLKTMGLSFEDRTDMLESLRDTKIHIWLLKDGDQHLIFLTEGAETTLENAYQWQ